MPPGVGRTLSRRIESLRGTLADSYRAATKRAETEVNRLSAQGHLSQSTAHHACREALGDWWQASTAAVTDALSAAAAAAAEGTDVPNAASAGIDSPRHHYERALRAMGSRALEAVDAALAENPAGTPVSAANVRRALARQADEADTRLGLILRTEVAHTTLLAKVAAWGMDPERDFYDYLWRRKHDNRFKDVSALFERGGPYTYREIRRLVEVDHVTPQRVRDRHTGKLTWQTSIFNCRCSIVRVPKSNEDLYRDGLLSRREFYGNGGAV